jgi:hypothetical protein
MLGEILFAAADTTSASMTLAEALELPLSGNGDPSGSGILW